MSIKICGVSDLRPICARIKLLGIPKYYFTRGMWVTNLYTIGFYMYDMKGMHEEYLPLQTISSILNHEDTKLSDGISYYNSLYVVHNQDDISGIFMVGDGGSMVDLGDKLLITIINNIAYKQYYLNKSNCELIEE